MQSVQQIPLLPSTDLSSGAKIFKFSAENFTELTGVASPEQDDLAYVFNSQGTKWLPGSLGGSFYPSGVYVYDGSQWVSDRNQISNALHKLNYDTLLTFKNISDLLEVYTPNGSNELFLDPSIVHVFDSSNFVLDGYTLTGGNVTIAGFSQNVNKISSSDENISLINVTGNLFLSNIEIECSGLNSIAIEMNGASGFESLDMDTVSFLNTKELGRLNGIRQMFWTSGFAFGSEKGFLLSGSMSGGATVFQSRIINLEYLLKADPSLIIGANGSIRSNANIDIQPGNNAFEFDFANFTADESYQLQGCKASGGGMLAKDFVTGDATKAHESRKSFFKSNTGVGGFNTIIGINWRLTSQILTPLDFNVKTKLNGVTTIKNAVHWTSDADNRIRWNSSVVRDQVIKVYGVIDGGPNDILRLHVARYDSADNFIEDVVSDIRPVSNVFGGLDYAYFLFEEDIRPNEGDYYELHITNETDGTDATLAFGSFVRVQNTAG